MFEYDNTLSALSDAVLLATVEIWVKYTTLIIVAYIIAKATPPRDTDERSLVVLE